MSAVDLRPSPVVQWRADQAEGMGRPVNCYNFRLLHHPKATEPAASLDNWGEGSLNAIWNSARTSYPHLQRNKQLMTFFVFAKFPNQSVPVRGPAWTFFGQLGEDCPAQEQLAWRHRGA